MKTVYLYQDSLGQPRFKEGIFLENIISKLTLFGAFFLSIFALIPIITANTTNVTSFMGLGGTALLIIVGVAMDVVKQIESFIISKQYEGMTI